MLNNKFGRKKQKKGSIKKVEIIDIGVKKKFKFGNKKCDDVLDKISDENVKVYKSLGYCLDCNCLIGNGDYEVINGKLNEKYVVCVRCGKRQGVNKLLKVLEREVLEDSKRSYLENITDDIGYYSYDTPILNEFKNIKIDDSFD